MSTNTELFSARELLSRFAKEDIEIVATISVSTVHPSTRPDDPECDEINLNASMTTLHDEGEESGIVAQWDNLSLLQIAERLGIDPDLKIWEVNEDIG